MGEVIAALLALISLGNGPAWVAELSAVAPERREVLEIVLPLGAHVAVGVYNTGGVEPQPSAEVRAVPRVIWFEHRTVFMGMAEERDVAIPFYLPEPKDCVPTGAWVVELGPREVGEFVVPIKCDRNTVTVALRCVELPPSDIGYGFYTKPWLYCDRTRERDYNRDMRRHGMNTYWARATPVHPALTEGPSPPADEKVWHFRRHVEMAIADGLLDSRFPVLLVVGPEDALLEEIARHPGWPEFVGYCVDEPQLVHEEKVRDRAALWDSFGLRKGTSIQAEPAQAFGDALDVWVLHAPDTSREMIDLATRTGKERWSYLAATRGTNAALHRYWTGVYTWAIDPVVCLTWNYMHDPESRILPDGTWNMKRSYGVASADAAGRPMPTVALEGMSAGIVDSRLLQELARRDTAEGNAYLATLREQVDLGFWPEGKDRHYSGYVWDVPDTAVPPIDLVVMRREVCRLLGLLGE